MKKVLIVSPHFPPVNAADMHRVRMSLPYYADFGWQPYVLAARPDTQELSLDDRLLETIPADVAVTHAGAIPLAITGPLGLRNVAMRGFAHFYRAGARLIRQHQIDLVYFSTTMFVAMALGRIWKQRFGVPYVIDLQDPWFSTYYDDKPRSEWPRKYVFARLLHRGLEAWTLRTVDGIVTVSTGYTDVLRARYPWITPEMCATIPFGASERDFELASNSGAQAEPTEDDDRVTCRGIYVGRGGPDMATALRIVFKALAAGRLLSPRFTDVALSFVGTDYAAGNRATRTVEPIAAEEHVTPLVLESTDRVGFLDSLRLLRSADFLVLIGSDDPQYSPSKIYQYILARRPIVAVVHERSPIADLIRRTGAGIVVTFSGRGDVDEPACRLAPAWRDLIDRLPFTPHTDWTAFAPYSTRGLTQRQCAMFDAALRPRTAPVPAPCTD